MAALALLEDVANCALRREHIFMEQEDLFHNPDQWLMNRYRLQLQPWLQRRTAGSRAVPVRTLQCGLSLYCLYVTGCGWSFDSGERNTTPLKNELSKPSDSSGERSHRTSNRITSSKIR
ncbi:uncharacterized protein V6R79_025280 [Siganus canaliculatus]